MALINLGNLYSSSRKIKNRESSLNKAIDLFNETLKIKTLKDYPREHTAAQNNLGIAFSQLSEIRNKETNLNKAKDLLNEALKVYGNNVYPDNYKMVKSLIEIIEK